MDQQASLAVSVMLDAFGAKSDPDVTIRTYDAILRDVSSQAIIDTAENFTSGKVEGQRLRFAPTPAEFATEARKRHEAIQIASKPRIARPVYERGPLAPFQIHVNKKRAEYADRPVLFEDVNNDRWRQLSKQKLVPPGSTWVACLGTVYGPKGVSNA